MCFAITAISPYDRVIRPLPQTITPQVGCRVFIDKAKAWVPTDAPKRWPLVGPGSAMAVHKRKGSTTTHTANYKARSG